jgi:hypothetical protein
MKLTDHEKRIKIAEACGWMFCAPNPSWPTPYWTNPVTKELSVFAQLPDYLNDLNAMHEAEKGLTDEQHLTFRVRLWEISVADAPDDLWDRRYVSPTAAERFEAFGRTLNLWTE